MGLALAASAAAFLGVLLLVVGFFQARRRQSSAQHQLDILEAYTAPTTESPVPLALRERGNAWAEKTRSQLEHAGLALKIHEYVALRALTGLVAFLVVLALGGGDAVFLLLGILAGAIAFMLPPFYVRMRIARQVRKFNGQLEEMITMVSNSLRAGFGLLQAFDLAAEQLQPPMSTELRRLQRDIRVGATLEDALEAMSERVGSYDLNVIVTAILIQRSVGSNLAEVLDKVAYTIRERVRLKGEINTLTSQKKLSGLVVGLLPPFIMLVIMAMSFEYMEPLFTTGIGRILLATAVGLDIAGILAIRRITSIEI